jgi:magnesium transporter
MIHTIIEHNNFKWIDVVLPSREELQQLAETYAIHLTSIQDCLQPNHLPKYEKIGEVFFLIARGYDEKAPLGASNVLDLTRKLAIFWGSNFLITVHRVELNYLTEIRQKWQTQPPETPLQFRILCDLLQVISLSYEVPLDTAEAMLDEIENKIFMRKIKGLNLSFQEIYLLRRKTSVYQRMLHLALEVLAKLHTMSEKNAPLLQSIKDDTHRLLFVAEQLSENVNHLLDLHVSLTSNRINEVMRVLTVFSVFFMPITFIVGIYGMNFHYLPELELRYGYFYVWLLMLGITVTLFIWFKNKGFL